jgi:hypothetical protein
MTVEELTLNRILNFMRIEAFSSSSMFPSLMKQAKIYDGFYRILIVYVSEIEDRILFTIKSGCFS